MVLVTRDGGVANGTVAKVRLGARSTRARPLESGRRADATLGTTWVTRVAVATVTITAAAKQAVSLGGLVLRLNGGRTSRTYEAEGLIAQVPMDAAVGATERPAAGTSLLTLA